MIESNSKNPFILFVKSQIYFTKIIYKEQPKAFILFSILTLLASLLPPFLILINKKSIDTISLINSNPAVLKTAILLIALFFVLQYINDLFDSLKEYIFSKISYSVNFVLKRITSEKLINIPLKEYEDSAFYDTINLANRAINGNGVKVVQNLISVLGGLLSLIGIFGILLTLHWSLPFALFLSTLPGIIFIFVLKFKDYHVQIELSAKERELGFTDGLFTNKVSLKEIKIYNLGHHLINKWSNLYRFVQDKNLKVAWWDYKTQSFATSILYLASFGISMLLVYQIHGNNLSIGSYVALLGAVTTTQGIFGNIGASLGNIFETAIFNNALLKILNFKVKNNKNLEEYAIESIDEIRVENASFCYPHSNIKVLNDVSLKIKKGENISIVGANGSGKTTLANCLLGLYELDEGSMKVNGTEIELVTKESFYSNISAIFQDFNRYKYDVRENVGFGDLSKLNNSNEIYNVLKQVGLYEKVKNFHNDLETYLTKEIPDGSELSGGEWQRIAIARAFLRESDLILLDEPTAALDPMIEMEIFETFHKLSKSKTTITISHRIGPTKFSDRIIVMDKGKIVEEGHFSELMDRKGLYYDMYNAQSKWYSEDKTILEVT